MMPTDLLSLALIGLAFLMGGLVKGALGLGLPVVVLAMLAPTIGLETAITLMILPSITTNLWQALTGGAFATLLARLWLFLTAAAIGIWFGVGILAGADTKMLEALLGVLLATYSAISLLTPQIPPPGRHERWMSPLMGGTGGVMFGMTGIFIVPGILYLQALGLGRDRFVQALGISFLTISIALGASMAGHARISAEEALTSLGAVLPTFLGLVIGQRVRHRISETLFRRVFFVALIVVGLYMILRALG